jgi:hypothetical protein
MATTASDENTVEAGLDIVQPDFCEVVARLANHDLQLSKKNLLASTTVLTAR